MRDAAGRGSFRTTYFRRSMGRTYASSADVATNVGRQELAISPNWQASTLVVGGVAYISGNQPGLTNYFGFPAAAARKAGSQWVSISSSNPGFAPASQAVLLESVLAYLTPGGHLGETSATKIGGQSAIGIRGMGPALRANGAPSALTLFVSTTEAPLPLRAVLSDRQGDYETVTLGAWGEHLQLKAPSGAIAILTLAH